MRKTRSRPPAAEAGSLFPSGAPPAARPALPEGLWVLDGEERLEPFDGRRIARALQREGGARAEIGREVARRIEDLARSTGLKVMPSSLIRELAGAEWLALDPQAPRARTARLGLSLYETGRLLRGEGFPAAGAVLDPEATGRELSRRIKREYGLMGVLRPAVAEAHRRGRIHVHGLAAVDRPDTLLLAAPGLAEAQRLARHAARALVLRLPAEGPAAAFPSPLPVEAHLTLDGDAVPAGSAARAWLEALARAGAGLHAVLDLSTGLLARSGHLRILELLIPLLRRGQARIRFGRAEPPAAPRAILGRVSVNLPRLAFEAGRDEDSVLARFRATLELCAQAHVDRRVFLEELLARGRQGPLAGLDRAAFDLDEALQPIALVGLVELSEYLTGRTATSPAAREFARRFLARAQRSIVSLARRAHLRFRLDLGGGSAAARFARLDLSAYPGETAARLEGRSGTGGPAYADGLPGAPGSLRRRLAFEGAMHAAVRGEVDCVVPRTALGRSAREGAAFLLEVWNRTGIRSLRVD